MTFPVKKMTHWDKEGLANRMLAVGDRAELGDVLP